MVPLPGYRAPPLDIPASIDLDQLHEYSDEQLTEEFLHSGAEQAEAEYAVRILRGDVDPDLTVI